MTGPRPRFDDVIHPSPRLSIVALLAPAEWLEFRVIRDSVQTSDSALSKQISALQSAGYVDVRKHKHDNQRPRTFVRLSRSGRTAFEGHVAALQEIVRQAAVGPGAGPGVDPVGDPDEGRAAEPDP